MGVRNMRLLTGGFLVMAMGQCSASAPWATRARLLPPKTKNHTIRSTPSASAASFPGSLAVASARGGDEDTCNILDSINDILSTENLSTLFASAILADGLLLTFAPETAFDLLGGSLEKDSLAGFVAELAGSVSIGTVITAALMASHTAPSVSLAKAVGLGLVPRICVGVKNLLTGKLERVGFESKLKRIAGKIAFGSVIVSSLILEKGKPEATMKILVGVETLVGLFIALFPEKLIKTADTDLSMEGHMQTKGLVLILGQGLVSHAVYVGCMVAGCAPAKALGATCATYAASQIMTVATKAHEDLGFPQEPFIGYAVALGGVAAKLLTGEDSDMEE